MSSARFRPAVALGSTALGLLAMILLAVCTGPIRVPPSEVLAWAWAQLTGGSAPLGESVDTVLLRIRLPRIGAALLVGSSLSAAGATFQGIFRNPLVSPDLLGVTSGAALGAVFGIFLSLDVLAIQGLAFLFGLLAVAAVYGVAGAIRAHDPVLVLVLTGVVTGALLGSVISLLKTLADPYNQLPAITFWLLGSLAGVTGSDVGAALVPVSLGLIPLLLLRWRINLLSLGEEEALALGVETRRLRPVLVAAATLVTAGAVAVAGTVGWVGLLVPHAARLLVGPDYRRLLPLSVLLGGAYLLAIDTLARSIARTEVPLGVLTALVGAPVFLWLLGAARRSWR